jgi:hypothetical protein
VKRNTDGHLIHTNCDTDVIVSEEPPLGSTEKPEEMYHIIERFCNVSVAPDALRILGAAAAAMAAARNGSAKMLQTYFSIGVVFENRLTMQECTSIVFFLLALLELRALYIRSSHCVSLGGCQKGVFIIAMDPNFLSSVSRDDITSCTKL